MVAPEITPGVAGIILTDRAGEAGEIPHAFWALTTRLSLAVKVAPTPTPVSDIIGTVNSVVAAPDQLYCVAPISNGTLYVLLLD